MNFVVIKNAIVMNIIEAPSKEVAEEATNSACVEYTDENPAFIGWEYDGVNFIAPVVEPIPE